MAERMPLCRQVCVGRVYHMTTLAKASSALSMWKAGQKKIDENAATAERLKKEMEAAAIS